MSSYQQPLLLVKQKTEDVSPIPENLPVIDEENNDETVKSNTSKVQRTGERSLSRNYSSPSSSPNGKRREEERAPDAQQANPTSPFDENSVLSKFHSWRKNSEAFRNICR